MYNHQLHYDGQLARFLADAKTALSNMQSKVWDVEVELPINQVRVWVVPHLPLLQTTPWVLVGHWALDFELVAGHKASLLPTANNQALWAQQPAIIPFIPKPPKTVRCQAVSLIPPKAREMALRQARVGSRPQVMSRRHPKVKTSRSTLTPRTPSLVLVSSSVSTRTPTPSPTPGRKSRPHGESSVREAPRRPAPRKTTADHHLQRKRHQPTRHSETELGKKCSCLTHALMLGIVTKLPTMSRAG